MTTATAVEPTEEQAAATETFQAGDHLVIQAGAGTGKTTTLALLAHGTKRRGRYVAFSRAIAQAAAQAFPRTVICKTAHALAFAAIGHRYTARLNAPRIPSWRTGMELGIGHSVTLGGRDLSPRALSAVVLRTVERYCHSASPLLEAHHVPRMRGIDSDELHAELADLVLPYASKAWADLQHPDQGGVRFEHDHYLKMWALSQPKIPADFLMLDEAQDTNPVLEEVFLNQRDHAQLVMVGDSAQAIYGWRGAKDVMTGFDGTPLTLSQSFRFGPALAQEANRWLRIAQAPIRLTGTHTIPTEVGEVHEPEAVLCRTNVGTMVQIMKFLDDGYAVALAGGSHALRALAHAARDLQSGRRTSHPELVLFTTWGDLLDYAEHDPAGRDLQPLADLVSEHGADTILHAADCLVDERYAEVTISTAHKAKGRQWTTVRIADDFTPPPEQEETDEHGQPLPGTIDDTEARLAYVAVTRARHGLDMGVPHPPGLRSRLQRAHPDILQAGGRRGIVEPVLPPRAGLATGQRIPRTQCPQGDQRPAEEGRQRSWPPRRPAHRCLGSTRSSGILGRSHLCSGLLHPNSAGVRPRIRPRRFAASPDTPLVALVGQVDDETLARFETRFRILSASS